MSFLSRLFGLEQKNTWFDSEAMERLKAQCDKAAQEWKVRNWVSCGDPAAGVSQFEVDGGNFYRVGDQVFFVPKGRQFRSFDGHLS